MREEIVAALAELGFDCATRMMDIPPHYSQPNGGLDLVLQSMRRSAIQAAPATLDAIAGL